MACIIDNDRLFSFGHMMKYMKHIIEPHKFLAIIDLIGREKKYFLFPFLINKMNKFQIPMLFLIFELSKLYQPHLELNEPIVPIFPLTNIWKSRELPNWKWNDSSAIDLVKWLNDSPWKTSKLLLYPRKTRSAKLSRSRMKFSNLRFFFV